MIKHLQQAGLWNGTGCKDIDIAIAWSVLARLGFPSRYGGKAPDGSYQYMIIEPRTGDPLSFGTGTTLATSICDATLKAYHRKVISKAAGRAHQ